MKGRSVRLDDAAERRAWKEVMRGMESMGECEDEEAKGTERRW